ncbi:Valine--tRNA ligase [Metamycoplasma arthritidis]|uniref:Valine--tRNA ligase n=1 Tax=Metamycoplasma arthritidis (strain 158L3-1) TaxID=243272 RepID=B3PLT3_META1|nr:valine--tRNA ligase [Metamycoplasma arthritidis]ACF06985.1 fusion of oligopeptide transport protein OppF and Valyl-tRNA synthetase [Metamycoplasma arthritidis 158L3-1]VEU78514.1 Valine--tRNA ligase [Metamycoplasma arthritidis]
MKKSSQITSFRVTNLKKTIWDKETALGYTNLISNLSFELNENRILGFLSNDSDTKNTIFDLLVNARTPLNKYEGLIQFKNSENYQLSYLNREYITNIGYGFDKNFNDSSCQLTAYEYLLVHLKNSSTLEVAVNDFVDDWKLVFKDYEPKLKNDFEKINFELQKKLIKIKDDFAKKLDTFKINHLAKKTLKEIESIAESFVSFFKEILEQYHASEYALISLCEETISNFRNGIFYLARKDYLDARKSYFDLLNRENRDYNQQEIDCKNEIKSLQALHDDNLWENYQIIKKTYRDLMSENNYIMRSLRHRRKNIGLCINLNKELLINKKIIAFLWNYAPELRWLEQKEIQNIFESFNEMKYSINKEIKYIDTTLTNVKIMSEVKKIVNANFVINTDAVKAAINHKKDLFKEQIEDIYKKYQESNRVDFAANNIANVTALQAAENEYVRAKSEYLWNLSTFEKNIKKETSIFANKARSLWDVNQNISLRISNNFAIFQNFVTLILRNYKRNNNEVEEIVKRITNLVQYSQNLKTKIATQSTEFLIQRRLLSNGIIKDTKNLEKFIANSFIYKIFKQARISWLHFDSQINTLTLEERIELEKAKILVAKPSIIFVGSSIATLKYKQQYNLLNFLNKYVFENHIMAIYFLDSIKIASKLTSELFVIDDSLIIEEGKTLQIVSNPINPFTKRMLNYSDSETIHNYINYLEEKIDYSELNKYQIDSGHYLWCSWEQLVQWTTKNNLKNDALKKIIFSDLSWSVKEKTQIIDLENFEETTIFDMTTEIDDTDIKKGVTMEKTFDHKLVEAGREKKWRDNKFFSTHDQSKLPFTIILPPPNVTGKLHIGHALDELIPDTIIRYKKLHNFDVMWVPGKDHAGIATQAVVERLLRENNMPDRHILGREAFLEEIWKWKDAYSDNITSQWQKMGLALDYDMERFTFDKDANEAVTKVFIDMYQKGLIYYANKAINWDPKLQTALSNIEVINKEVKQKMYYLKYYFKDSDDYLEVATTRLETLYSDVAVAINPQDPRANELVDKILIHPLTKKEIPIITSEKIKLDFGTGAMKVSAHAIDDIEILEENNLEVTECIDKFGKMNKNADKWEGKDRFEAREGIFKDLEKMNMISKVEEIISNVGHSERSDEVIEILKQPQWFVKMNTLAKRLLADFNSGKGFKFIPDRFGSVLEKWMNNAHDWTISRQIWWGHRIPAWYKGKKIKVQEKSPGEGWVQDPDVLDTWFSSALAPFVFLGWPQNLTLMKRYFPTDLLVTSYDIIFFWVARMYFQSLEFLNTKPFKEVFIHGLLRDGQGRKISKSLRNGIDPIKIIEEHGVDVLKMSLIFNVTAGQDMNYGEDKIKSAKLFINKFWNIARLISSIRQESYDEFDLSKLDEFDVWILNKFIVFRNEIDSAINKYEFNVIFKKVQDFVINDFASWYLEFLKLKSNKYFIHFLFKEILITLHPFISFTTDYLFENIYREELLEANLQNFGDLSALVGAESVENLIELITTLRQYRESKQISKSQILYFAFDDAITFNENQLAIVNKLTNFTYKSNLDLSIKLSFGTIYIALDDEQKQKEIAEIEMQIKKCQEEIAFNKRFLENESFLKKAPENLINQKKKLLAEFENKLSFYQKILEEKQNSK